MSHLLLHVQQSDCLSAEERGLTGGIPCLCERESRWERRWWEGGGQNLQLHQSGSRTTAVAPGPSELPSLWHTCNTSSSENPSGLQRTARYAVKEGFWLFRNSNSENWWRVNKSKTHRTPTHSSQCYTHPPPEFLAFLSILLVEFKAVIYSLTPGKVEYAHL